MLHETPTEPIASGYLVVGAGAMGMAFVDTMLYDANATITIVGRYHAPGGHWTTAYPYVRLHQPSNYYGMKSKPLGADRVDIGSYNYGLFELASGSVGAAPSNIFWIMPPDSWLFDHSAFQPEEVFAATRLANVPAQVEAIHAATSANDLLQRLCDDGQLLRLDDAVGATMFRCATVSRKELGALRCITSVVRKGRVLQVEHDEVLLEHGSYAPKPDTLFIDCTADGLAHLPPVPIFTEETITLQPVRFCQQVFSAAFIAHVETTYTDRVGEELAVSPDPAPGYRRRLARRPRAESREPAALERAPGNCAVVGEVKV